MKIIGQRPILLVVSVRNVYILLGSANPFQPSAISWGWALPNSCPGMAFMFYQQDWALPNKYNCKDRKVKYVSTLDSHN